MSYLNLPVSRIFLSATLLSSFIFSTPGHAYAQAEPTCLPEKLITTQGTGEVKVQPDSLQVNVMVQTQSPTLLAARTDNNQKMQQIIQALKALKIPNMTLKTQYLQIYPIQSNQEKNRLPKVLGYNASNSLNVTVTGATADTLSTYGSQIVDTSLNAGANNVGGINFFLNDMAKARRLALQEAVQDAKQNADAMAQAVGVTLTGTYSLEGSPQYSAPMMSYARQNFAAKVEADMAPTPVEVGETTITSTVTARFRF